MRDRPRRPGRTVPRRTPSGRHSAPRTPHPAPKKHFAQHFLEPVWVDKVIRAIDPQSGDRFIEIGPGHGALTRPLAARAKQVLAYEIDRDLVAELRASLPAHVTVVEGDVLAANLEAEHQSRSPEPALSSGLRVAGNLPYNVAAPILFKLVDWSRRGMPLIDATVMLQLEVAERLAARPGSKTYGVLSVLIQHRAAVEQLLTLPPGAFRPPPKVRSALVRLRFHAPDSPVRDESLFERLVQAVFTHRRKTIANALRHPDALRAGGGVSPAVALERAGIDGRRRPETLSVHEFATLTDRMRNNI